MKAGDFFRELRFRHMPFMYRLLLPISRCSRFRCFRAIQPLFRKEKQWNWNFPERGRKKEAPLNENFFNRYSNIKRSFGFFLQLFRHSADRNRHFCRRLSSSKSQATRVPLASERKKSEFSSEFSARLFDPAGSQKTRMNFCRLAKSLWLKFYNETISLF